ncbi:MAG TPA: RNA-binding protein [Thermoanaerobaculia bacterium]|jgi:RNA recognition motif-containing protein
MRICIRNLPTDITDVQLRELALPFGQPDSANVARKLVGGASKGFAFVEYRTSAEALAAIAGLDGKVVQGQALHVVEAKSLVPHPWSAARR